VFGDAREEELDMKAISGILLTLLLIGMATLTFDIQLVEASGTIYLRADGSVDPDTAPISTVDNVTYTFNDDIHAEIEVYRSDIIIDGNGFMLQGTWSGEGLNLHVNNVTIQNTKIQNFFSCICLVGSSFNTISGNEMTDSRYGIELHEYSDGNSIYENNITDNTYSFWLCWASNNLIYHNNIISERVRTENYPNVLDNGYPSGGNYWSTYDGVDVKKGVSQTEHGSDGIGDTAYVISSNNRDRYPLMTPFGDPPTPTHTLTIEDTDHGTTNPPPGIYTYAEGQNVPVQAMPDTGCVLDYWELDGADAGSSNPISVLIDMYPHHLRAVFTYDVLITAYCSAEGGNVNVDIWMDGSPTGHTTPYVFTSLTGTHTFTVPSVDSSGHLFKQWYTGVLNRTIIVGTSGTHTAYYDAKYNLTITANAGGITDPVPGIHTYWAGSMVNIGAVSDSGYYLDYWEYDSINIGAFTPISVYMNTNHTLHAAFAQLSSGHDVAVKGLSTKAFVGQGYLTTIAALAVNVGSYEETLNVSVYANETCVASQNITLQSGAPTPMTFMWNTTGYPLGNYTIRAYVWPVPDEVNLTDNTYTDSRVLVTFPGDVNGDEKVRIDDILAIALCFGLDLGDPEYDPDLDVNGDGKIRVDDILAAALNFGLG